MHTLRQRLDFLRALDREIDSRQTEIEVAHALDFRKAPFEVLISEIAVVRHEIQKLRRLAPGYLRRRRLAVPLWLWPGSASVERQPRGRVLIIAPWNFPFQLSLAPLVGAVACGNQVTLKPSELTPAVSALIADMVHRCFPADLVSVELGDAAVAQRLLERPWDLVFFTGSSRVGRLVAQAAGATLSPVVLELGGKNPVILLPGTDLETAARRIVWGKILNAGQTCVAPDYVLVPRNQLELFVEECRQVLGQFFPDGAEQSEDYPAVINDEAFLRLTSLLADARIAYGGSSQRQTLFIEPAILTDLPQDHAALKNEIFGPLLPVLPYDSQDDAIAQVRAKGDALAAYVFGPAKVAHQVWSQIRSGGGCINDVLTQFSHPALPFGGVGTSGFGHYHGRWSLETFTRPVGLLQQPARFGWPFRYPPYGSRKTGIVKILMH